MSNRWVLLFDHHDSLEEEWKLATELLQVTVEVRGKNREQMCFLLRVFTWSSLCGICLSLAAMGPLLVGYVGSMLLALLSSASRALEKGLGPGPAPSSARRQVWQRPLVSR